MRTQRTVNATTTETATAVVFSVTCQSWMRMPAKKRRREARSTTGNAAMICGTLHASTESKRS